MKSILRKIIYSLPVYIRIPLLKKVSLLYYNSGLGDSLLVAAVAREVKKKYGNKIEVTVNCVPKELLRNNPYIDQMSNRYDGIDLNYHFGKLRSTQHFNTNLLDIMCSKIGIKKPTHTVDLFLNNEELKGAEEAVKHLKHPLITIQTTSGNFDAQRKWWPQKYWEELVNKLKHMGATVIQLGSREDIILPGVINFVDKLSIRESAAIISLSNLHIGIVSSLMHIAEAVETKSIILFGGFERYAAHDYKYIIPIESNIECSPCGIINTNMEPCPINNKCMNEIKPATVFQLVYEQLEGNSNG